LFPKEASRLRAIGCLECHTSSPWLKDSIKQKKSQYFCIFFIKSVDNCSSM
jgi:hypothetical protein